MQVPELLRTTVNDIQIVKVRGPWHSKSGGILEVQLVLPQPAVSAFLDYDNPEFGRIKEEFGIDIRGIRSYTVSNIDKGQIGGKEWHLARTEYVAALTGSAVWRCVDFAGNKREIVLDSSTAIIQPPGILHTYEALEDNTRLQVICNTLFTPEDPRTHDTYTLETFYELLTRKR